MKSVATGLGEDDFIDLARRVLRERGVEVARSDLGRVYDALPDRSDPPLQRFRDWLGEHIWAEDDMGGFLQPFAARDFERQTMANVRALFDLLDPDWRSFTWSGRRGGETGRRPDPDGG